MKTVVILSSAESPQDRHILNGFTSKLQGTLGDDIVLHAFHYRDIGWRLDNGASIVHVPTGTDISRTDFVWFKSYVRYEEEAVAIAHLLGQLGISFASSELLGTISTSKLTQYARLWAGGLPIPRTAYMPLRFLKKEFANLQKIFGEKLIIKAADGKRGDDNYCITTPIEVHKIIRKHKDQNFVIQEFIPNEADYRVLIVGNEIKLVIKRRRTDNSTHLNNTSRGANAQLVEVTELSRRDQALCIDAAQTMKREVAGVDLMYDAQTNKPYILEVNSGPQVGSGAFTEEKLVIFTEYLKHH